MAQKALKQHTGSGGSPVEVEISATEKQSSNLYRNRIQELFRAGVGMQEMYQAGLEDGRQSGIRDMTDILFFLRDKRLGRMNLIQESNCHAIFKIFDCVCCELGNAQNCHYMAGFLAGALQEAGRPNTVKVREVSCGGGPGCDCVFEANW